MPRVLCCVLLSALGLGACRDIAEYGGAGLGAKDSGPLADGAGGEAGGSHDGTVIPPDGGILDGPSIAERAACSMAGTTADDGDLLLGDDDPEPAACNKRVYALSDGTPWDFRELDAAGWATTSCMRRESDGSIVQDCLTSDDTEYFAQLVDLPAADADYLVEATVVLTFSPTPDAFWKVDVLARFGWPLINATEPYHYMSCGLSDFPYWSAERPDMHIDLRRDSRGYNYSDYSSAGVVDAWNPDGAANFSVAQGLRYRIQVFYRPPTFAPQARDRIECHLFDTGGTRQRAASFEIWDTESRDYDFHLYMTNAPATIGLRVVNATARFEDVRVFELFRNDPI